MTKKEAVKIIREYFGITYKRAEELYEDFKSSNSLVGILKDMQYYFYTQGKLSFQED